MRLGKCGRRGHLRSTKLPDRSADGTVPLARSTSLECACYLASADSDRSPAGRRNARHLAAAGCYFRGRAQCLLRCVQRLALSTGRIVKELRLWQPHWLSRPGLILPFSIICIFVHVSTVVFGHPERKADCRRQKPEGGPSKRGGRHTKCACYLARRYFWFFCWQLGWVLIR